MTNRKKKLTAANVSDVMSVEDNGRLLWTDSPALRWGSLLGLGLMPANDEPGEIDRLPVALFEPPQAVAVDLPDGTSQEFQVEQIIGRGLGRMVYPFQGPLPTPGGGWVVKQTAPAVVELHKGQVGDSVCRVSRSRWGLPGVRLPSVSVT